MKQRMVKRMKQVFVLFVLILTWIAVAAQSKSKIELVNANTLEGGVVHGEKVKRFLGNVAFKQDNVYLYCDSAYFYDTRNAIDAFSHVHILQGDSLNLFGDLLKYDGNTREAELFHNIRMTDTRMTLTTEHLNYNLNSQVANYNNNGKIVDKENVLTSVFGYYNSLHKEFFFKKEVVLTNPKYTMHSDTLKYNTATKKVFFFGPTTIDGKAESIYCENGWYSTLTDISQFNKNAFVRTKGQTLRGDSLYYNKKSGIGKAFKNIQIRDSVQNLIITGDYAESNKKKGCSNVTGKALLTQLVDNDSLFLHADTLQVLDSTSTGRVLFAYHHVKIYKKDFSAKCDSMVYVYKDSTLQLHREPIVWSNQDQLTAKFITIEIKNKVIHKLNMYTNAFIVSKEDSSKFNQVKGKKMEGFFYQSQLYKVFVEGNGQTVYYAKEKDSTYTGVNRADCSNILLLLKESKVEKITLINAPDANFYPLETADPQELRLKGFEWKIKYRPECKEDIFYW
jgi:lipopolysaccharide export system protein LptA